MAEVDQHPHGTGQYQCSLCPRRYPIRKSLVRHVNATHRTLTAECPYEDCPKRFARKDILDRHIRTQHVGAEETIDCGRCGKQVRVRSLPAHQASDGCRKATFARACGLAPVLEQLAPEIPYMTTFTTDAQDVMRGSDQMLQGDDLSGLFGALYFHGKLADVEQEPNQTFLSGASLSSVPGAEHAEMPLFAISQQQHSELDILDAMIPEGLLAQAGERTPMRRRRRRYTPTPTYLPAIACPVLLSAWLFIKLKPWGPDHRWEDPNPFGAPLRPFARPSVDVLELRAVVFSTLRHAIATQNLIRDPFFPDALIMLVLFTCQTEGWNAAIPHGEPLLWLANEALKTTSRDSYRCTKAADAFAIVLSRYVKSEYIEPLQRMFVMAQKVMRATVVDLIDGPFEHLDEPVWRRPYHMTDAGWYLHYKDQLVPIQDLAGSIPGDIERVSEVLDDH